jgi:hypothetical protein
VQKLLKLDLLLDNFRQHRHSILNAQALNFTMFQLPAKSNKLPPLVGQPFPISSAEGRRYYGPVVFLHGALVSVKTAWARALFGQFKKIQLGLELFT